MPLPQQHAIITVSVWNDTGDPAALPMARILTSYQGGPPQRAGYAQGADEICEAVLAFLIMHFS